MFSCGEAGITRAPAAPPARRLDRSPAPLPSRPTSRPTPERIRQGEQLVEPDVDGRSVRRWWGIKTRLDGLLASGLITADGYDAACRLRSDVEHARGQGGSPLDKLGVGFGGGDREAGMFARIAVARRVKAARALLGRRLFAILVDCAVHDLPWPQMARRLRVTQAKAKRAVAKGIEQLLSRDPLEPATEAESCPGVRYATPCPKKPRSPSPPQA
jgi:hypothetical protein